MSDSRKSSGDRPVHYTLEQLVIDFSVDYALQPPVTAAEVLPSLLVCLHGYGQSCERFARVFAGLRQRNILLVVPQAPSQFYVKMVPKIVGFSWLTRHERDRSIGDFIGYMRRLLQTVAERHPFDPARVFWLGFSQGVSMAYRFAVSGETVPGGVIACGADLPPDVYEKLAGAPRFPVFIAHGTEDTVVPLARALEAEKMLQARGFAVDKFFFPGGHEIPPESVERIGSWIEGKSA